MTRRSVPSGSTGPNASRAGSIGRKSFRGRSNHSSRPQKGENEAEATPKNASRTNGQAPPPSQHSPKKKIPNSAHPRRPAEKPWALIAALREELRAAARDRELLLERAVHSSAELRAQSSATASRIAALEAEGKEHARVAELRLADMQAGFEVRIRECQSVFDAARTAFERERETMKSALAALEAANALVEQQVAARFETRILRMEAALESERTALAEKEATVASLLDEREHLTASLAVVEAARETLTRERSQIQCDLEELRETTTARDRQTKLRVSDVEERLSIMTSQRDRLQSTVLALKEAADTSAEQARERFTQLESTFAAKLRESELRTETANLAIKDEREKSAAELEVVRLRCDRLEGALSEVRASSDGKLRGMVEELNACRSELSSRRALHEEEIIRLQAERERLLAQLDGQVADNHALRQELDKVKSLIARSRYFRARAAFGRLVRRVKGRRQQPL